MVNGPPPGCWKPPAAVASVCARLALPAPLCHTPGRLPLRSTPYPLCPLPFVSPMLHPSLRCGLVAKLPVPSIGHMWPYVNVGRCAQCGVSLSAGSQTQGEVVCLIAFSATTSCTPPQTGLAQSTTLQGGSPHPHRLISHPPRTAALQEEAEGGRAEVLGGDPPEEEEEGKEYQHWYSNPAQPKGCKKYA